MTSPLSVFITAMNTNFGANSTASKTPPNLADSLPFHRAQRVAGADVTYPYDEMVVAVDTYAASEDAAYTEAEAIRTWVRTTLPGQTVAGRYINGTTTELAPVWAPWDNTNAARVTARYRINLH